MIEVDGRMWIEVDAPHQAGVAAEVDEIDGGWVLTLRATRALAEVGTGAFADPGIAWALRPRVADLEAQGVRSFGYQYMEFALPSAAGPDCRGLAPWPLRPAIAFPVIWAAPGGPAVLVGPLDRFHDQVLAVPTDERPLEHPLLGWHGDLAAVPAGFATRSVVLVADGVRAAIARYGAMVLAEHASQRGARPRDPAVRGLSYWTDNGARYYYRPEAGMDYPETLAAAVAGIEELGLPVHAVQLDSWWYPQRNLREIGQETLRVPPSGMLRWEPRDDALPGGFDRLQRLLGHRPLVLHSRHFHSTCDYFADGALPAKHDPDTGHAAPVSDELMDLLMEQAASWGAVTYEQDWLVESVDTVRPLRARPGGAGVWQRSIDRAAARRGLTLQWCMATPADFLATADLTQVSSIRTSMDFNYAVERQANWGWFLHTNALARALGLATSKDVFVAARGKDGDRWHDPLAGVECMLAALSCGPVGIGDRIGRTDADLVRRAVREDGVIVCSDVPVAAIGDSFLTEPMANRGLLVGEAYTDHPAAGTMWPPWPPIPPTALRSPSTCRCWTVLRALAWRAAGTAAR